ncbi:pimeloyl-ACP methyl ester carboxylesterase [Salana multivorans]|uniref:Pimeloyl-ACP methyl ester carboxylesterase n=1 Tax=Salana multivorans TaxID=120377 RepID=A0A3N2D0N7_9MICO|nr:alpha/beta hydrolase [Salana multivorans]ROR93218.1 pimeloyl-ACP methyl ester carboxylesterase [Salana multivorans]
MDFIESDDGVPIGFELIGAGLDAGDPVLVLPGGPCRDPSYVGDLAGAAGSRRLAILHVRGTPATGGLSRGWWADAADAVAVADRLGIDAADVVAHSAGTRLALAMAVRFPERVRSLALVTPAAAWLTGVPHDGVEIASRRAEPEVAAALASAECEPIDEEAFRRAVEVESPLGYARWGTEQRRHAARGAMTLAAARSWFRGVPADAADRILRATRPPTLVVGGDEDILSGVAPVRAFAAALGAELVQLEDCGHYPWVEQPEAFRRAMTLWLTGR